MENNSYIEFKKERDLGSIISDTFKFIRENWREYFNAVIKIVGPFILAGAIIMVFFLGSFEGIFSEMQSASNSDPSAAFGFMGTMFGWIGLLMLVGAIIYVMVSVTSLYFIKSYINNNGKADFTEVKKNTFKNIWKFIGLGFLIMIMIFFGAILCYIPGIYLGIVFSLATSIMVFEDKSIGDTISHCFTLIKGAWWPTFGVLIVVGFLVSILGSVFSVPAFIYQIIKMATMAGQEDPTQIFNFFSDPIYIFLNVLSYVGKFILSSITLIATVFLYFDLNEQKNLTGTIEKIERLGQ
ncbi:MAG TPA: hypothetical protein ENK46_08905 [Flavobacteriia bacterium]|jgi:hypothetical protein|nr:hypothetical protein [Flavobacteriia bacterium]